MELTEAQKRELRLLYQAKGDVLEAIFASSMMTRGIEEGAAREAAKRCTNLIWRNSMGSVALAGIVIPILGAVSFGTVVGLSTYFHSDACQTVRGDGSFENAIQQLNAGQ